jgi:chemosensory pili system protein ChpA (sensor histidine kinase/response regulator)
MDPVLYEIFSKESSGHINTINDYLETTASRDLEHRLVSDELIRALHTLHGSARMAGADNIAEVAGTFEKFAKVLYENETPVNDESQSLLESGVAIINEMLGLINKAGEPKVDVKSVLDKVSTLYEHEFVKQEERQREEQEQALQEKEEEYLESVEEDEFDQEVVEVFLEEGSEILDSSEVILQRLSESPDDAEAIAELQRELHTLKGGARMSGIKAMGDLSHSVESVLTAVVEEGLQVTEPMIDALQRSLDKLIRMLEMTGKQEPLIMENELIAELDSIRKGESVSIVAHAEEPAEAVAESGVPAEQEEETAEIIDFPVAEEPREDTVEIEQVEIEEVEVTEADEAEKASSAESALADDATSVEAVEAQVAETEESTDVAAESSSEQQEIESEDKLAHVTPAEIPPPIPAPIPAVIEKTAQTAAGEMVRVRSDLLDNLVNYAGEVSIFRSRLEQQIGAFRFNLVEMDQTVDRLREQLRKLEIETEAQILFRYEQEVESDEKFDPLELDRYSTMQQLSRALMETTADIASIQNLMDGLVRESETLMVQQARVNTDLQEGLMRTRMVSFSGVIPRLQRITRQTSQELRKKAKLNVSGEAGELDRNVLERITAPLEHMIRNALSHGIESPQERQSVGKPESGVIDLTVSREGSEILLSLVDDGAGMDLAAIRKKAEERGLLKDSTHLTDNDIMQFILESGFSTAEQVTQISGRGVGMDVVNSEIKQLGGSLNITSEPGKGTKFVIRLPLTLAMNHALLVKVSDENYAIPLTSIEGIVRMTREELEAYQANPDSVYQYAGSEYQVQSLGSILHAQYSGFTSSEKLLPVLLVRSGDHHTALQVDELLGSREIVVKSVGPQLSTLRGVSGATILGDGRVVLILDMGSIIRLSAAMRITEAEGVEEQAQEERKLNVMVVDDSITVRKVTTRLLERNDMHVITAKDGVDAVATLHEHIPDIMLLDIEMPRMDGFELATYMRNEPRLQDIPIIMITSRTGDKHRRRAEEIGVQRYLGKPYQEHDLLENINSVIEEEHGIA